MNRVAGLEIGRDGFAAHPRDAFAATKRALRGTSIALSPSQERWFLDDLVPAWCTPEVKQLVTARLGQR